MRNIPGFLRNAYAEVFFALACVMAYVNLGQAQNNAVYDSAGTTVVHSNAFIDPLVFLGQSGEGSDLCDVLYKVLNGHDYNYPGTGAVIDARGFSGASLTCALGSPWSESGVYINKPSVILLPPGTISTSIAWVLPNNTKLIGTAKGSGALGTNNYVLETTILPSASFSGAIVQFGDSHCSSSGCQGISVEHLTINGGGNTMNGIENDNCGLQCYADHVTMFGVLGTGLEVSGANATDSGPYSNITFDVGSSPQASTRCAQIIGTSGTRGIHGLTCVASPSATNAILLDAPNNSIEDVQIVGFYNGIVVGSNALANNNVLLNVYGSTSGSTVNLVTLSANNASDSTIMSVGNTGGSGTVTIQDLQTSTNVTDPYVGMYVLGEANNGGYTRFTTSTATTTNDATWMFGSGAPPTNCNNRGSLYSDATGGDLYVCIPNGSSFKWVGVL